jgi:hypothetical protein
MATDLFEQLSQSEVPPPPDEFDRQFHRRLNQSLLVGHFVELGVRAIPFALGFFMRAVIGLLVFSFTGRFPPTSKEAR